MPTRLTAAALRGHSALGLAFAALLYLVCVTGTVSALCDELRLLEQPLPAPGRLTPGAIDRAMGQVLARGPKPFSVYAVAPQTPRQRPTVTAYGADGERAYVASSDGRVVPQRTPFTDFVTELHMTLTAPAPWGSLAVGITGAALLSLILSGVLSHSRIFRDAFHLRLGGSVRLREADLHNRLSVWGLPFHLTVTLTGALFGLSNLAILAIAAVGFHGDTGRAMAPVTGPSLPVDARPAAYPDLEALVRKAQARLPGSQLYYVGLQAPGARSASVDVELGVPARLPRGEDFFFDAQGREIGRTRFVTGPVGLQAYSAAARLHFGTFGGLPVRLVYVLLGAALSFVCASGVTIWLERRADRGRPTPRLRAAWLGWTWGLPAALLAAALASRLLPPSWTFWTCALGAPFIASSLIGWRLRKGRGPEPVEADAA